MCSIRSLILLALVTQQLQALSVPQYRSPHSLSIAEPVGQSQASFNVPQSEISFSASSSYDGNNNGFNDFDFDALRLVRFFSPSSDSEEEVLGHPVWVTERAKLDAKKVGRGYIDITEHPEWGLTAALLHNLQRENLKHVYHPPNSTSVTKIFPLLSSEEQKTNLEIFTSFYTRSYISYTGYAAAQWLYQRAVNYTEVYASDRLKEAVDIELELQEHSAFKQNSVIIRLSPKKNTPSLGSSSNSGDITIIGAHLDSINKEDPFSRSPGADDDGSGTVTVLEAYRGILQSGYVPTSPLEFHFYAGEEGGLLGSIDISNAYATAGKNVRGMIEFDMTAWVEAGKPEEIGIIMNLADPALTEFLKLLVDKYIDIPWSETRYPGRAGSDYMSWTLAGYQSCHTVEAAWENMNPNPHQETDTFNVSSEFSFDHILRFTKLAVAFAVELSDY